MGGNTKVGVTNLDLRRGVYNASLYVPAKLRAAMGKRVLRQSLRTGNLQEAIRLSGPVLSRFRTMLAEAADRAACMVPAGTTDWLVSQAAEHRRKADELARQAAAARSLADWALSQVALVDRRNPAVADRQVAVTFQQAAEQCIEAKRASWKHDLWTPALAKHVFPHIGNVPVHDVQTDHILAFLAPLWQAQPETAIKVRARAEAILDYAKVRRWRDGENPCKWDGHLEHILSSRRSMKQTQHHAALDWQRVPEFVARLQKRDDVPARAFEFAILAAARKSEVLGMKWDEVDIAARVWTVPAGRMKGGKEHRVPLCDRMLAILKERESQKLGRDGGIVFAGRVGAMSRLSFNRVLGKMDLRDSITAHGFRSSFRDWAIDNGKDSELAEFCLAHVVGDAAARAYRRSDVLERRRVLMGEWSAFCVGES
jgi:integrase